MHVPWEIRAACYLRGCLCSWYDGDMLDGLGGLGIIGGLKCCGAQTFHCELRWGLGRCDAMGWAEEGDEEEMG